mgnify:CR=1 FL=1
MAKRDDKPIERPGNPFSFDISSTQPSRFLLVVGWLTLVVVMDRSVWTLRRNLAGPLVLGRRVTAGRNAAKCTRSSEPVQPGSERDRPLAR